MRRLSALVPAVLWACIPNVPASNPYDPDLPAEQQQKASVFGIVYGDLLDGSDPDPLVGARVELNGPASRIWPLSSGINPRSVYVLVQDFAGNTSATASDAVNLDTAEPTAVLYMLVTDLAGNAVSTNASIHLDQTPPTLNAIDLVGRNVDGPPNRLRIADTNIEIEVTASTSVSPTRRGTRT